jgi:predicted nucleotidyltransferase
MVLYEEITKEFQRQKVKYVIVGGIAVNLHGFLRSTADMDILVEMSSGNLKKIVNILKKQEYRVKQPVDPMGLADKKIREEWIRQKHMKAFNFYKENELKEVDIILESSVSFKKAKKSAFGIKIDDTVFPVISIDNLILMKRAAARDVDKMDIKQLTKIKKLRECNGL